MYLNIVDKDKCVGCGNCALICPNQCINMKYDREGFLYPFYDAKRCSQCKKCMFVCAGGGIHEVSIANEPYMVFAVMNKNSDIVKRSSSGGVFYALAKLILQEKGCVFGAVMQEDFTVAHKMIENIEDIGCLMGSKYLQSSLNTTFKEIRNELGNQRKVLFVGTPCQIEALYLYLKADFENLFLVEIVCHGVPSKTVFDNHIKILEHHYQSKVIKYKFHSKNISWRSNTVYYEFENGNSKETNSFNNTFLFGFFRNIILRKSCYLCRYRKIKKIADIVIGDFWEIRKIDKRCDHYEGTSMVLIYTQKGMTLFEKIKPIFQYQEVSLQKTIDLKKNLKERYYNSETREKFMECMQTYGYDKAEKLFLRPKKYLCFIKYAKDILLRMVKLK